MFFEAEQYRSKPSAGVTGLAEAESSQKVAPLLHDKSSTQYLKTRADKISVFLFMFKVATARKSLIKAGKKIKA